MTGKAQAGTEMVRTSAISRTLSRRRQVASTIHSHSKFSSCMTTMRYTWPIAIHIRIQTALNYSLGSVSQNLKTGYERP